MGTQTKKMAAAMPVLLKGVALKKYKDHLSEGWKVVRGHHLEKEYVCSDFAQALALTSKVGAIAEKMNHHPDIALSWGKVRITIWTHSVGGLSEKDFSFAQMCDRIFK
jgi:4a-hydroxytetrahydrobiopterin dehydratase